MSTEGVDQQAPEVDVAEHGVAPEMPKQARASSHPPYFQMIKEALLAQNEKSGSSPYAIAKYMEEKHKAVLPANFRKILNLQLKNSVEKGNLIKIKASYKLSGVGKSAAKSDVAKAATASDQKKRSVKKSETPKKAAKQVTAKKPRKAAPSKPKQPRSIKSSTAKKAKKVTA